jgi:hypothetical protein
MGVVIEICAKYPGGRKVENESKSLIYLYACAFALYIIIQ